jgi:hypothetical protein
MPKRMYRFFMSADADLKPVRYKEKKKKKKTTSKRKILEEKVKALPKGISNIGHSQFTHYIFYCIFGNVLD